MIHTADTGSEQPEDRSIVPGFADPVTEELQQRRPGTGQFDIVLRGYERGQVDNHLAQVRWTIQELRNELVAAQGQARVAIQDARRLSAELERGRPDAEVIGGRIGKILALAEAEAEQVRAEAASQVQGVNAERDRILEDAQAHAESLVSDAQKHVAQLTEGARREAAQLTESARRDLDTLASRHAAIVNDLQRAHLAIGEVIAENSAEGPPPQAQAQAQPQPQPADADAPRSERSSAGSVTSS